MSNTNAGKLVDELIRIALNYEDLEPDLDVAVEHLRQKFDAALQPIREALQAARICCEVVDGPTFRKVQQALALLETGEAQ